MPAAPAAEAEGIGYFRGKTCKRRRGHPGALWVLHFLSFSSTQHSVVMSVLEREEMDRQLHCAKTDLFAEQRRSREKLESMQDVLYFY